MNSLNTKTNKRNSRLNEYNTIKNPKISSINEESKSKKIESSKSKSNSKSKQKSLSKTVKSNKKNLNSYYLSIDSVENKDEIKNDKNRTHLKILRTDNNIIGKLNILFY
jgi:hypothetical protein